MGDPPDDPGGTMMPPIIVPPAVNFVTIASSESGMDTDGSQVNKPVKRSRSHKCKSKKKKRHNLDRPTSESHCSCSDHEVIKENEFSIPSVPKATISSDQSRNNDKDMDVPSPQSNVQGSKSVARPQFDSTDVAPYVVHVQRTQLNPNDSTILHPMALGRFLKRFSVKSIINGSVKRLGRNRVAVSFSNYIDANTFINNNILADNNLKAFIPSYAVTRMGIVRGIPTEWSPEEIIENISVPLGCGQILKARRLNYKVMVDGTPSWKPTQTIVLTFDGQILPKRIYMCFNALPVDTYTFPTIQCYNCCRYGHTKIQCRSKPRCYKCGKEHTGESCRVDEDCVSCCLCGGVHFAISKTCPEMSRQKQIKTTMAHSCISYAEAIKLHPTVSRPYSEVAATPIDQQYRAKSSSQHPSTTSYRKTVIAKPKSPPKLGKSYDYVTHRSLTKDYDPPSPSNGCAYSTDNDSSTQSITQIITMLLNLLLQSNIIKPNYAASIIDIISRTSHNNGSQNSNSMELSQCPEQEK